MEYYLTNGIFFLSLFYFFILQLNYLYMDYAWENLNNDLIKEVIFVRFNMIFY